MAKGVHKSDIVTKGEEIVGFLSIIYDMVQPTQMNVWKRNFERNFYRTQF